MARAMALDTSALENPPRRSLIRPGWGILGAILGLALWGGIAGAQDRGAFLAPYWSAIERGQFGTLRGSAFVEPRRRQETATPLAGVTITVLPPSPRLLADLEAVKAHARDSARHYLEAAGEVRRIKDAYELALYQGGAADLVFTAVTDEGGRFELPRVPAGEWVLLGRHELLHAKAPRKIPQSQARGFALEPTPSGYRAVTYWLIKLMVEAGKGGSVELHDRSPWFTGVQEEKTQGVLQKKTP